MNTFTLLHLPTVQMSLIDFYSSQIQRLPSGPKMQIWLRPILILCGSVAILDLNALVHGTKISHLL